MEQMCRARLSQQLHHGAGGEHDLALPASAETPGITLLCGFSSAMLRSLVCADAAAAAAAPTSAAEKLRATLRGARYRRVREAVAEVGEGKLAGYVPGVGECVECDADDFVVVG
eukprot:4290261-Prymnesium_polylepis.2